MSVSRVVWLPLVVELEGANPESLRGSFCVFILASLGDSWRLDIDVMFLGSSNAWPGSEGGDGGPNLRTCGSSLFGSVLVR